MGYLKSLMELIISEFKIIIKNLSDDLINNNNLNQVFQMFTSASNNYFSKITVELIDKVIFPIELSPRADALYGEKNSSIYLSSTFFNLEFNFLDQKCQLQLFNTKPKEFYLLKAIKLILSIMVLEYGGIPFHCSSVSNGNEGFIFTGVSGSGKTTAAVLLSLGEYQILNDEFNIILPFNNDSHYKIYSTPFTTANKLKVCNNLSSNLSRIFFVNKAKSNYLIHNSGKIKFSHFLNSIYTFPSTKLLSEKMLKNAESIYKQIIPEQLYFINNSSFTKDFNRILNKDATYIK